jgi:hypothetical protein
LATNDLADLNSKLATQLRDTAHSVWATGEKDYLIQQAVDTLWPRFSRPLDPESTTITLVAEDYFYSLPTGVMAVSRVDLVDSGGTEYGPIFGRAWEVVGDVPAGTGKIHVGPVIVDSYAGGTLRLNGYGRYGTATNLIPNHDLAQLALARARAEAYRRVASDRQKFTTWLARNQVQNVSINELIQLINEADAEAGRLAAMLPRTWQLPVQGRVG